MASGIFVVQPFTPEFEAIYGMIKDAASTLGVEVSRADEVQPTSTSIGDHVRQAIQESDLIICDVTHSNPNVMYELGLAQALGKPVIIMARTRTDLPFSLSEYRVLLYDLRDYSEMLRVRVELSSIIEQGIKNPSAILAKSKSGSLKTVFVSYSHQDRIFLDRLLVHLRPLERAGVIDVWEDSKIKAGANWKAEIERALGGARVAILLISADFLASDFIVKNELPPLLADAESKGTHIIPAIVKPCRFARDENLSRFQAVNNPSEAIINLSEGYREAVYDRISEAVEAAMRGV